MDPRNLRAVSLRIRRGSLSREVWSMSNMYQKKDSLFF